MQTPELSEPSDASSLSAANISSSDDEEAAEAQLEGEIPARLLQQLALSGNGLWSRTLRHLPPVTRNLGVMTEDHARFASLGTLRPQVFPFHPINRKLGLVFGDIAALLTDAIVCPAAPQSAPRSELATHIATLAGPTLAPELRKAARGAKIGDACATGAGALPCRRIVHAFCPVQESPEQLRGCIEQALYLLTLERLRTAAFPVLAADAYPEAVAPRSLAQQQQQQQQQQQPPASVVRESARLPYYPLVPALHVLLATIREWLEREENRFKVDLILLVAANERERRALLALMPEYFPRDTARESASDTPAQEETSEGAKKKKKKGSKKGKRAKKAKKAKK